MPIAIVAIPANDDYVWKISSEKVPHMTLMMLGDKLENVGEVEAFLAHVVNTSLRRFGMDVDHRGVLGDKNADVLFFGKYSRDKIDQFQGYLLNNPAIYNAYNSVEQFPQWTPHLTLGYPETPAHPDNRDYPGITWVNFDRIALWTGDYEGMEFPLKADDSFAMAADRGAEFLAHYGVKGMHWGQRKAETGGSGGTSSINPVKRVAEKKKLVQLSASQDHKDAQFVRTKAKVSGVSSLTNQDLQKVISRMNLEVQYKSLKKVEHEQSLVGAGKKFVGDILKNALSDALASWLKRPGSNASGRTSATAYQWGSQVVDGALANAGPKVITVKSRKAVTS